MSEVKFKQYGFTAPPSLMEQLERYIETQKPFKPTKSEVIRIAIEQLINGAQS